MAHKADFESEKLDMDALEGVVAGAGTPTMTEDEKKKAATAGLVEVASFAEASVMIIPTPRLVTVPVAPEQALQEANSTISAGIGRISAATSPADAAKALNAAVTETSAKLKASLPGLDNDTANAMAWSSAYKMVFETASTTAGKAAGVVDALKGNISSHVSDVARGLAAEVGYSGDLKGSLTRSADAMAQALKGAGETAANEIRTKGAAAFEAGLEAAKGTGIGKSVMAAFDDPKNIEKWKEAWANAGYSVLSPTALTPIKFLAAAMSDQATAKMIGLGDYPSEVKQTAKAVSNALDGIQSAFVDVYKSGFFIAMTGGLDIKGVINIGQNCADLGKAMVKGDTAAMAAAAKELVTDMMYDLRDGLKTYYVDAPSKAFNWTKDITVKLMDDLGATPHINAAAKATADAFTDFGNAAKNGSINAMNVLEEFAKNEVPGALSKVGELAKGGLTSAVNALEDVARTGVKGAVTALGDALKASGGQAAIDAVSRLITSNVPGALSEISKLASSVENATWAVRKAAEAGSVAALNEVANLAKTAAGNFQRICVDAVQQAVLKDVPGAVDKMADLVRSGTNWAEASASELARQGGRGAMQVMEKLAQSFGAVGQATAVVEWAAKYATNEVGKAAITHLENISKSASQYGDKALDALKSAMLAGGTHANAAWDAVARTAETVNGHSQKAISVMTDLTKAGGAYASQSFDSLKRVAESGGQYVNQAVDGLSIVAKAGTTYANAAIDELKKLAPTVNAAKNALEGAAREVGGYAEKSWNEVKGAFSSGGAMDPRSW